LILIPGNPVFSYFLIQRFPADAKQSGGFGLIPVRVRKHFLDMLASASFCKDVCRPLFFLLFAIAGGI